MDTKVVFLGSPEFALPSLASLADSYQIVGVVTQPDRPAGRGRTMKPPPVKVLAGELKVPVIQPQRLTLPEVKQQLMEWNPDLIVVAAYGKILKPEILDIPQSGCINVHASLLPRWRGAAPVQAAILHGDAITGVTIMLMDAGMDTGPILSQQETTIHGEDTSGSLGVRLSKLGADLLGETLSAYLRGEIQARPQDDAMATYSKLLNKEDGLLDFTQPAGYLARKVRAFNPWPGTYTFWKNKIIKIHQSHAGAWKKHTDPTINPGDHKIIDGSPAIGTSEGILVLDLLQPAGKKPMSGRDFLLGARDWEH